MVKRVYGTHYGERAINIGNIKDMPDDFTHYYIPFKQTIYFNPLSPSGNFKFRLRHWFWNQHVPATNTGSDVIDTVFIDYDESGDMWTIDPITDRTTGYYDYKDYVNEYYNECLSEYNSGKLNVYEFYEKLYDCHITVTFYIRHNERSMGLYPDDINSLHEQQLEGRLGRDRNDIKINIIFPKLTKISYDFLYNYDKVGNELFKDCDRLQHLDDRQFDTLVNQTTLESWFENSGVISLNNRLMSSMKDVTSIKDICKNSNIQYIEYKTFYDMTKLETAEGAFSNTELIKIEREIINIDSSIVKEFNAKDMFADSTELNIYDGFKFKDYIIFDGIIHTDNMLGNIIVYDKDEELLDGMNWDKRPTNAIYMENASLDTSDLTPFKLHYKCNKDIDIEYVSLAIVSPMGFISKRLEHTKELTERIVIRTDIQTVAYDPRLKRRDVADLGIDKWDLKAGDVFDITIFTKDISDIIGVYLYTRNNKGDIGPYYIDDEIQLTITGSIPKSNNICKMSRLYHELWYITNTDTFFKHYIKYDVDGLFSELPYFNSADTNLLVPLKKQTRFNYLLEGNKVIEELPDILSANPDVEELNYAFSNMISLTSFSPNLINNLNLISARGLFKNDINLVINDYHINLLTTQTNLETIEEFFMNCESLVSRIAINTLNRCISFKRMYYGCKNLVINDYHIEDISIHSNDLVKFGTFKLNSYFDLPPYDDIQIPNVDLTEMYANINHSSIIYRRYETLNNITKFNITDIYKGIQSPFSDKYLFNGINLEGNSGILTITPYQEFTITIDSLEVTLGSILTHFGMDSISNKTKISDISNSPSIWYPEYKGNIEIDWGDGIKEDISYESRSKVFNKKRSRFKYAKNTEDQNVIKSEVSIIDNTQPDGINILPINIEYYPKDKPQDINHIYDTKYIGKQVTIKIKNRYYPISITSGGTINAFSGSLPWSRLELLDLTSFRECTKIDEEIFKYTILSVNTRLKDSEYSLFERYNGNLNSDIFKYNINLHILDRIINNSLQYEFKNDLIVNLPNVNYMKDTFKDNINMNKSFRLPTSVRVIDSIYKNTNVLKNECRISAPNLRASRYVFNDCKSDNYIINYPIILESPVLYDVTGMFKGSKLTEVSKTVFSKVNSIRIANELFMDTLINNYDEDLLYTNNIEYANYILSGTKIISFNNKLCINNSLLEANYALHNCSNLGFISPFAVNNNTKLRSINHFISKTPIVNIPDILIEGLTELSSANYMLAETGVTQLDIDFFKTNINLSFLEGFLYRTPITLLHDNMLENCTKLRNISHFIEECMNMSDIPNLGIKVREYGEPFDFRSFAANSTNISFLQKKFTDIMLPYDPDTKPTLLIEDSLRNIKASFEDEQLADGKFIIVGKSNAIYVPNPSVDIVGLNELTFDIDVKEGTTFKPVFKIYDYTKDRMQTITNATELQKSNRVVVKIDEIWYGLDKRIDEEINRQNFPSKILNPGPHTISIYTEPIYKDNEISTMIDAEICILDIDSDIPTRLSGNIPIGKVDKDNIRTLTLRGIFGTSTNIISVTNLTYNSYNDNVYIPSRYFAYLNIRDINLDIVPFHKDHMLEQFIGCKKLYQVFITKQITLDGSKGVDLSKFFYDCQSLEYFPEDHELSWYFNPIIIEGGTKVINTPINFSYMFYNTKLHKANQVIKFIDEDLVKYAFKNCFTEPERTINLEGIYSHSAVTEIINKSVEVSVAEIRSKVPSYNLKHMYENTNLVKIPTRCFTLGKCSNLTRFSYSFYEILALKTIMYPIISMDWIYDYPEYDNEIDLEHLFGLSVNAKWERLTIKRIIEYYYEDNVPMTYLSYGMLENIISYLPDDKIFKALVYSGETLAIYQNKGPDISGMNKFTMYFDMKHLIGSEYLFRILGPSITKDGYIDLTYQNSNILNSKLYVAVNDDLPNAIEYYPDEDKTIIHIVVTADSTEETVLNNKEYGMREYDEPAVCIKFDIYTDNNPDELSIKELLGTIRPNLPELLLGFRIEGSMGYSEKMRTSGLMITTIFKDIADNLLYDIGVDTFNNYKDFESIHAQDDEYSYGKSLLAGIKGCKNLKYGTLTPLKNMTSLVGILAETSFETIDENIMKDFKSLEIFNDTFANARVPNTLNRNFFKYIPNLKDVTGFFYKATNTEVTIPNIFDAAYNVEVAKYLYAKSDIRSTHVDMFRYMKKLKIVDYAFYNTEIQRISPIFLFNDELESAKSLLENSTIEKLPAKLFFNRKKLKYIDSLVANCSNLNEISKDTFLGSDNIDSANYMAYKTPKLLEVYKETFESFRNCRFINSLFEESGLNEFTLNLMDNFINVLQAKNVFKNVIPPKIIPDEYLKYMTSCVTMFGMFEGDGRLTNVGNNVIPVSTSLEDVSNFFKGKRDIELIPDEYFSNAKSIKYMNSTYELLSSLKKLPSINELINLEEVAKLYKECTSIKEVQDRYFYNNRKIHIFDECFAEDDKILVLGKELINPDYTIVNKISCINAMSGCTLSLNYNQIDYYILGTENIKDTISIHVNGMFNGCRTFFDETYVWEPVKNKVGDSMLTHIDKPSEDIENMNMIGITINPSNERKLKYKLVSLNNSKIIDTSLSILGRLVIKVDASYTRAYDNAIYYNEPIEDIIIPNDNNPHTIYIYTENLDDVIFIHGLFNTYNSSYDEDMIEVIRDTLPKLEILGGFSSGLSKLTNINLFSMVTYGLNIKENELVIEYPIISVTNDIIKNIGNILPRINDNKYGGFFANLWVKNYPDNLIPKELESSKDTKYDITVGLFYNNIKLTKVNTDILTNISKYTKDLSYMYANCLSLIEMVDIIPRINVISSINYLTENCISLERYSATFGEYLGEITMDGIVKGCRRFIGFNDEFFKHFSGKVLSMNYFAYDSGYKVIEKAFIDILANVTSMKYAFAKTKITTTLENMFNNAKRLRIVDNISPIEGCFSDILTLTSITGNLGLLSAHRNITKLFSNSINLAWRNKRVSRSLYKALPGSIIIDNSFENIHVNWENDSQLFDPMTCIGESKAIFDGRLKPSEDTTGLNDLRIHIIPNTDSKEIISDLFYRNSEDVITNLYDTSELSGRIVIKIIDAITNTELNVLPYDHAMEESRIYPINIPANKELFIDIYTENDYIGIKVNTFKKSKLLGSLPQKAFIDNKIIPLSDMFATNKDYTKIFYLGKDLLKNTPSTNLDLSNTPFNTGNYLEEIESGLFNYIVDQEYLDDQFINCVNLITVGNDIISKLTKLKSIRNLFKNCNKLNMNLENFFKNHPELIDISGSFSNTLIDALYQDMFKFNTKLKYAREVFDTTKIKVVPENLFISNKVLVSIAMIFRRCQLDKLPDHLGLNLGCYSIERIFFNCPTKEVYNHTVVEGLYIGIPQDTVSLIDAFYNVRVNFNNEGEFVTGIRFIQGDTGAIFK